jgi:hypothetical protein
VKASQAAKLILMLMAALLVYCDSSNPLSTYWLDAAGDLGRPPQPMTAGGEPGVLPGALSA